MLVHFLFWLSPALSSGISCLLIVEKIMSHWSIDGRCFCLETEALGIEDQHRFLLHIDKAFI
jgi:hypothetical protein